jgi:hypothetical protein
VVVEMSWEDAQEVRNFFNAQASHHRRNVEGFQPNPNNWKQMDAFNFGMSQWKRFESVANSVQKAMVNSSDAPKRPE